jgi:hypothetical protein
MLGRDLLRLRGFVHIHFHDWELVDRRRALALQAVLRALRLRRKPLGIEQLTNLAANATEIAWPTG